MTYRVLSALAVSAGLSVLGAGCKSAQTADTITLPNPLKVRPERPLADVPVPAGFTYKGSTSYVFTGNYRVAKLVYRGTPHVDDCVEFFKAQAPVSRWAFVRDSGPDDRTMLFHNDVEEMTVKLARTGGVTFLEIGIKPRPV